MRWLPLLLIAGCAHGPRHAPPPEPEEKPITVAVIEFGDRGRVAENGCVMAVLEAGFRAIEHARVEQALPTDDVDYQQLGKTLGADLIIDGGILRGGGPPPPNTRARLISAPSGAVLAVSKSKLRVDKSEPIAKKICADLLNQLP